MLSPSLAYGLHGLLEGFLGGVELRHEGIGLTSGLDEGGALGHEFCLAELVEELLQRVQFLSVTALLAAGNLLCTCQYLLLVGEERHLHLLLRGGVLGLCGSVVNCGLVFCCGVFCGRHLSRALGIDYLICLLGDQFVRVHHFTFVLVIDSFFSSFHTMGVIRIIRVSRPYRVQNK